MILTLTVNLGLLGYFKYANFFMQNLSLLGLPVTVPNITLPIGISFFTFQGMSYALDVYRGDAEAEKNPFRVALYIALFPQLVAGPIVRYTTVAGEIADRRESFSESGSGAVRFCLGLAKKMLLANAMGQITDAAFGAGTLLTTSMAWLGAIAYTGQIYFDFSGYSDMAIGLGRVFGFHFLENFNYPYVSRSATEFWRRWHISLSTWFRDYVYIPLGGNRCSRRRQVRNILAVWLLTGMWHGAAWNFILWGLYYGLLLLGEKFLWGGALGKAPGALQHLYTLLLIVLGWTLFRAESLAGVGTMVAALFGSAPAGLWSGETLYYLSEFRWELLLAIPVSLPVGVWVRGALERRKQGGSRPASAVLILGPRVLALGLFGLSVLSLLGSSFNPFIYFRFYGGGKMKKIADIALVLCLAAALFAVPALTLVKTAHNTVSYYENRSLTERPELTAESFWSGEYFNDWETWYADHVPCRTALLALGTAIQMDVMGKPVVNDVIVTQDVLLPFLRYGTWDTGIYEDKAAPVADRLQGLSDYVKGYGGTFLFVGLPEQSNYFWDKYPNELDNRRWNATAADVAFYGALEERDISYLDMGGVTVRDYRRNIARPSTTISPITVHLPPIRR